MFKMLQQIIRKQHRTRRDRGKNIARKFRLRDGEENDWHDEPAASKQAELKFKIRLGER